jgi:hypothetical protein
MTITVLVANLTCPCILIKMRLLPSLFAGIVAHSNSRPGVLLPGSTATPIATTAVEPTRVRFGAIATAPNDEVDGGELTVNEDAKYRSFDVLLSSPEM